ncbi:hypothetical protein [Saccharothrix lopnurensis]|uniref:Uncharacterized protein n=1 Tax=Saccharothrix lopnurensis TaxID=1670621 RepID=A0ABW1PE31_9PSEU
MRGPGQRLHRPDGVDPACLRLGTTPPEARPVRVVAGVDGIAPDRVEDLVNRHLVGHDLRRLTVVVDQFDEAPARFPDEAVALLDVAGSHHRTPRVALVVTTTSEALDRLLADPRVGSRLAGRTSTPSGCC